MPESGVFEYISVISESIISSTYVVSSFDVLIISFYPISFCELQEINFRAECTHTVEFYLFIKVTFKIKTSVAYTTFSGHGA